MEQLQCNILSPSQFFEHDLFMERYLVERQIGEGSYGKVKLAVDCKTRKKVALKIIHKSTIRKAKHIKRVTREVRILKLLNHPNIVKLYDFVETEKDIVLVMEYVGGGELFDVIVMHKKFSEKTARRVFRQLLSAVDYCHKSSVIHRDLKPENLLLDKDGNIKIIDFGFANLFDESETLNTYCGSPFYSAPEMILQKSYVGPEIDVWSLGVILYTLLTGKLPFHDASTKHLYRKITTAEFTIPAFLSREATDVLHRILCVDPCKRATIEFLRNCDWINAGYSGPPDSLLPLRHALREPLDEEVLESMKVYGYQGDEARLAILASPESGPAFSLYWLLKEGGVDLEGDREVRTRKLGEVPAMIEENIGERIAPEEASAQVPGDLEELSARNVRDPHLQPNALSLKISVATASASELPDAIHVDPLEAGDEVLDIVELDSLIVDSAVYSGDGMPDDPATKDAAGGMPPEERFLAPEDLGFKHVSTESSPNTMSTLLVSDGSRETKSFTTESVALSRKPTDEGNAAIKERHGSERRARSASQSNPLPTPPAMSRRRMTEVAKSSVSRRASQDGPAYRKTLNGAFGSQSRPSSVTRSRENSLKKTSSVPSRESSVATVASSVSEIPSGPSQNPRKLNSKLGVAIANAFNKLRPRRVSMQPPWKDAAADVASPAGKADHHQRRESITPRVSTSINAVDTTSSKTIPEITKEVERILRKNEISSTWNGFKVECIAHEVHFEIEICHIKGTHLYGLEMCRKKGSTYVYQIVCRSIISQLKL
ncbi:hypothetical protein HDU97_005910 [Phlyctochytrium planicorne]|nr:hypothetical protein HDU97_005910 [Phlyctochytrium planicorne]